MRHLRYKLIAYEVPDAPVTLFFISSFKTPGRLYRPFYQALNRMGCSVYVYSYRSRPLLHATPQEWVDFSGSIAADVARQTKRLRGREPAMRFGIIGVSVGSVMALHAAKLIRELERVMLVSVYGSNARQTWEYAGLGFMREYFESRGIGPDEAGEAFGLLEPTKDLRLLAGRPLLIFAGQRDKVIRFSNTQVLVEKARELGLDCTLHVLKTPRHSITNIRGLMSSRVWRPFLMPLLGEAAAPKARPSAKVSGTADVKVL